MGCLTLGAASGQTILRVNQAAAGAQQDGQAWATAFTRLEDAIAAAQPSASQPVEIWVAKGTYKPTSGTDRTAAFRLKSHLVIRGGFRGNETSKAERTPYGNPTVLSGDIGVPMVGAVTDTAEYPAQAASANDAGWQDNSYNVLVGDGVTGVVLEFLTITGGSATNPAIDRADIDGYEIDSGDATASGARSAVQPSSTVVGGGLFFTTGPTWTVSQPGLEMADCRLVRNRARGYGGAIGLYDGSALFFGCSFEENVSDGPGGAFWGLNQQSGFIRSAFSRNSAADGGGAVKIMGLPSDRASNAAVDGFNDTLRGIAFSIYGLDNQRATQDRIGSVLTAFGIYKAANKIAATEGGFFTKVAATVPNPFAKSTTQIGGSTVVDTSISPGTRLLAAYALIQIGMAAGDNIVKVLDAFGKLDKNSQHYQNWVSVHQNFNKYATPQGLISLGAHATINAALPTVSPDLIGAKRAGFNNYTQAGRSGFVLCSFVGNRSGNEGGAIELVFNNLLVEGCTFERNTAASNGGAISSAMWNMPQVISSVFANNSSDGTSAIANSFSSLMMIVNCTIINNRSEAAQGKALSATMGADVRVYNSILWNNASSSVASGADVEAVTESMLNAEARKRYDALQGERVNWLGIMDIRNSIVQSLNTIPVGTDRIAPRLAGANLSQSEINAAIAATRDADARGELESTGAVNVGAGVRPKLRDPAYGNSAEDPLLLAVPLGRPSVRSPANNAGNSRWITWKMISHATSLEDIFDVASQQRILNARVDIGAYEVDGSRPDSAPLAGPDVATGAGDSSGGSSSEGGPGSVPTVTDTTPAGAVIYYVKPTASGTGSGSSWANATSDLQSAISHPNAEVWVAAGTYKPTGGNDRSAAFSLAEGVKVFGGFNGTETTRIGRNWKTNVTIISGDIGAPNVATDNSKNLFKNVDIRGADMAVLDGFQFVGAYSDSEDGGAILNINSNPAIQNCLFVGNHARKGGAICSIGTTIAGFGSRIVQCEFRDNSADVAGGAVHFDGSWSGANLVFENNTSPVGGAIYSTGDADGQGCTIQNSLFVGNDASAGVGGAIWAGGQSLYVINSTLYANEATVNSASPGAGGGIYFERGTSTTASLGIYNSILYKNAAFNAGVGGRDTVERQQVSTAANSPAGVKCSLIQGLQIYTGNGNLDGDPLFVQEGTNFRVSNTSPTIDAGTLSEITGRIEATDLDGNSRIVGEVDLGPYEQAAVSANPIRKIKATTAGLESYSFTANEYVAQSGDVLQWQVNRGDTDQFTVLQANDPGQDALPDEYLGLDTAALTILSPPSGFLFRLKLVRGTATYYSPAMRLHPTALSKRTYIYVRPTATGDGSGSGWANATSDLQAALSQPYAQVWVQQGTYYPTSGTDRDDSFAMARGVRVYGGFRGTESVRDARNPQGYPTIISGNIGSPSSNQDNSRHLFRNENIGASALLDGFTLEGAYADGVDGGAILNINASPTIKDCVFQNNHARKGGAIASTGTPESLFASEIVDCRFENNTADLAGGAISANSSLSIEGAVFEHNEADAGGAIHLEGSEDGLSFTITNGLFVNNRALSGQGGAIFAGGVSVWIASSTFHGNTAKLASASPLGGGAVYQDLGIPGEASVLVFNSIFYENECENTGTGGLAVLEEQQIAVKGGVGIYADHCLIQGLNRYANIAELGNFDENPGFADAPGGDFRLSNISPAINAGGTSDNNRRFQPATDLEGNARVVLGVVDLGPYEYADSTALGRITSASELASGQQRFLKSAGFAVQAGDALQWYVDRGDGNGFVPLNGDGVYSGVTSSTLTITAPPSSADGYLFRLQVFRGGNTLTSLPSRLTLPLARIYVDAARLYLPADGATWSTAYGSLADALKASGPGTEIWVAGGTYLPTSGSDTTVAFRIPPGVSVYGGFPSSATSLSQRNPAMHPSILSGRLNGATGPLAYSRHVVVNQSSVGRTTILDGFVLEDAYSSLIRNEGASPTIRGCVFRNNDTTRSGEAGAAISNVSGANPLITECQFLGNKAVFGGAVSLSGANATIENSVFAANHAVATGGAFFVERGTLELVHCTVADNTSQGTAAALYLRDGTVTAGNSIFWNNETVYAGRSTYERAFQVEGGALTFAFSCVEGGTSLPATNLGYDPIFDPSQGGDYALAPFSPLVNAASPDYAVTSSMDVAGRPRIRESAADIGAYELATNALAPVRLTSMPGSRVAYNIGGSVDFTLSWPQETTVAPTWLVYLGTTPVDPARYSIINGPGFSTVRLSDIGLADTGVKVSFTDSARGISSTPPAILTVKEPRIVRVNPAATGSNDGSSWTNAYTDLAVALSNAETADEIWVVGGTYTPAAGASFQLARSVTLLGGFSGSESSRGERDPVSHPTILRAAGDNMVLYAATPAESDSGMPCTLDGFVLENGTGPIVAFHVGVSAAYRNCVFRNNAGYIGNFESQVEFDHCDFTENTGSLFLTIGGFVTLGDCRILDNTTAVDLVSSSGDSALQLTDTEVARNTVAGALVRNSSGPDGGASLTILRSSFRENATGGGVIANGPGATCAVESSLFAGNPGTGGLATIQNGGTLSLVLSTVVDNGGGSFGGGLATDPGGETSINGSILWGNRGTRRTATLEAQQLGDFTGTTGGGTLVVKRSTVEGLSSFVDPADLNTGYYPLFADRAAGDYRLVPYSPAVDDAASNPTLRSATDLDNIPRRNVTGAAGAYEFTGTLATPILISSYPGSVTTTETTAAGFTYVGQGTKQWQFFDGSNWVNITGDTGDYRLIQSPDGNTSQLYFDAPSHALDGTLYRLVLTLGGVTHTSADLVLSVKKPRILYVNGAVAASGNGTSWSTAFRTIQEALAATDEHSEIWVQAGSYQINSANLSWETHLYGGFAGNETLRDQRDWAANEVILLGQGQQIFRSADSAASRKNKTRDVVLDGFTLTGSTAQAAVFLQHSDATIANCRFHGNSSAIGAVGQSSPVISNCVFESHASAVLALDTDTAKIEGCSFQNNGNVTDSIVSVVRGAVDITDTDFTGNNANFAIVAAWSDYDATTQAYVANSRVTHITMSRCRMTGNTAYAGIYAVQVLLDLDNSLVAQNTLTTTALWGATKCVFNLTNVTVADNTGTVECAGIRCDGRWTLENSIVWGNRSSWPYGPLISPGSPALVEAAQIKLNGAASVVKTSTIEGAYYVTLGGNPNANSGYDPLFADAGAGDYQLLAISPAIDAGAAAGIPVGTLDLASQPRLANTPDRGAYEFTGTAATPVLVASDLSARKVIVGQGTQYSVKVPAGVSVQWQVKTSPAGAFVDVISGGSQILSANGTVLTLSNVSSGMSGSQFRYVLSGPVSYESPAGTLTVLSKAIVYVDADATGSGDGTSWANAYVSVRDAVLAAAHPITGGPREIWVAEGTYLFTSNTGIPPGVELYGGFSGNETTRAARNVAAHPAILTRNVAANLVFGAYVFSDGYADSAQVGFVVDGFTFNGSTGGVGVSSSPGVVRNCSFNNLAGYGVSAVYVPLTVEDCAFDQPGGKGLSAGPGSTVTVRRSTFRSGVETSGTGLFPGRLFIEDSTIQNNAGSNLQSTIIVGSNAALEMTRCRVEKNQGNSAIENDGTLRMRQCLVADNLGTGVSLTSRAVLTQLTACTVANNSSIGVRIGWQNASLQLANSIVAGNGFRQIYTDSGGVSARYTLIEGETYSGDGNQSWDPLFVDAAAGDYTLAPRSPGINAGDAGYVTAGETDLVGAARIQSTVPDLGAYESAGAANALYRSAPPASLTTTRGVDGTFSLRGAGTYTYTWQFYNGSSWVDITYNNTTGNWEGPAGIPITITTLNGLTTLSIPAPLLTASGLQFRVTIDGEGFTSAPAVLTVNEPEIMYVDASVATSGDGKTWSSAFKTLSEALAHVVPSRRIIYVAAGTYTPPGSGFEVVQRVEIYGGFPAGGGAFSSRDAAANRVILSGEIGDLNSVADNAAVIMVVSGLNSPIGMDTILDGLTLERGKVGISITNNAKPLLRNLVLAHNTAGGLSMSSAGGRVENCRFLENSTSGDGGGALSIASDVTFSGCSFRGNAANGSGGGISIFNGTVRLENAVVSGNRAGSEGGGINSSGGTHQIVNCTVVGNFSGGTASGGGGGGLFVYQGTLAVWNSILWANRSIQASANPELQISVEKQQLSAFPSLGNFQVAASNIEGLSQYTAGNFAFDPLFYSGIAASDISATSLPTLAGDFRLSGGSPLVDLGDANLLGGLTVDADQAPRSVRAVDPGAYEFQGSASDPLLITQQPADLVLPTTGGPSRFQVVLSGTNYSFQWESSTDGVNFTPVVDGPNFSGAQDATLQILANDPALDGMVFRVRITASGGGGQITSRVASLSVYPAQYYVNASAANDDGNGYSWATAFQTIGTALRKARVHPVNGVQIWVAEGTYLPSTSDAAASFPIRAKVELYGGFTGVETALSQRDYAVNPTILKGIAGSTAVFASTGTPALPGVRIDGFAIHTATSGISLGQNIALTVANCAFSGLSTGITADADTLSVQNCTFTGLTQTGISAGGTVLSVADSTFTSNRQGIVQVGGTLALARSVFRGNGAADVQGGALKTYVTPASIESCLFAGNFANQGGAIYGQGGNNFIIRNCTIAGNYASGAGGGISFSRAQSTGLLEIYNSILWGNTALGLAQYSQFLFDVSVAGGLTLRYNNVQDAAPTGDFRPANGNTVIDPKFQAPVAAASGGTTAGDYRLSSQSGLIDLGSNAVIGTSTTDLIGAPRAFNTVDMGAYEFPVVPISLVTAPVDASVGAGMSAVFSVASNAANAGSASYQWQVSTDGGSNWTDLTESSSTSGVQTSTLTVAYNVAFDGYKYRVHVTTPLAGELFSNGVTYRVVYAVVRPETGVREQSLVGRTSLVRFVVEGGALASSIVDGAFAVHGSQSGRLNLANGTLSGVSVTGDTVSLQTAAPFKAGESIEITTSSAVQRVDGYAASPMVYRFRAGSSSGYGVFPSGTNVAGAGSAASLSAGDVDANGTNDLVIGETNGATVWLNAGSAAFTSTGQRLGTGAVSQVLLGSLGITPSSGTSSRPDVILRKSTGDVEIWRNTGSGTFTLSSSITGVSATSVAVADLNGDGARDLFLATSGADQVWLNNGAGAFTDSGQRLGSGQGLSVAIGDSNNDNSLDVFTANGAGNLEVWRNDGKGNFTAGPVPSGSAVNHVIAADLDKDGRLDLVTVRSNGQLRFFRQFSNQTFGFTTQTAPAGTSLSDPTSLAVGDLDGDGFPDVVFNSFEGSIQVWRGQGYNSGTGAMNFQRVTEQPALAFARGTSLADVSGDGAMDAVSISAGGVPTVASYAPAPAAPTSLVATAASDTRITLTWLDNATNETGYTVERSANGTSGWSVIASSLPANSTSYADTGRSPATPYYYRVRCNVSGLLASAYSNVANATTAQAGFVAWIAAEAGTHGLTGATDDPDGDGLSNFLEYAFGGAAGSTANTPRPIPGTSGSFLTISFDRERPELTYIVEGSSDLGVWTTVATNPGTVGNVVQVQDAVELTREIGRRFLRVRVIAP